MRFISLLCLITFVTLLSGLASTSPAAVDPASLPAVGYHPGSVSYYDTPYFADAFRQAGAWQEYAPFQWGDVVPHWNQENFSAEGYPLRMPEGKFYRALVFGLHVEGPDAAQGRPDRAAAARGRVALEWAGNADVRLFGGTFDAAESTAPETGRTDGGKRVYRFTGSSQLQWVEVLAIDPSDPITRINVWLADPTDPLSKSLEGQLFHPAFLARLNEADWGFIRTMGLTATNASPQQDWGDRRLPATGFQTGRQQPRSPGGGSDGDRETGVAWEHLVALANATDLDLWINIPHLATDDYVTKLAQLIRFGSDGVNPYTAPQANPIHPPLESGLRLYVEYSNEIWSSGFSFPQGDWAQDEGSLVGLTKQQFNARRFCDVWRTFQQQWEGTDRLVRVAATFTALQSYTQPFLEEMAAYGPTLNPPVEPDVIAVTTYFGNGIQDWAFDRSRTQAGSADPWFFTTETFDAGGGQQRPVSLGDEDPYWGGDAARRHLDEAFDEWHFRMLSGDAREGAGPDAVGIGGGFDQWLIDLSKTVFPSPKPIIAYEGGPSIYTDGYDGGDVRDDGITTFMSLLNRHPRMASVYRVHLNMAASRGLRTHVMFTDSSAYGKYGQWGHLEQLTQETATSPKYQFILDWIAEQESVRHIEDAIGTAPTFSTAHNLTVANFGAPYEAIITPQGGDGALALEIIGESLLEGLASEVLAGTPPQVRISGTPSEGGVAYIYTRVLDADGDPEWRTFTLRVVGGANTILQANFEGTNPGEQLPWTPTYIRANGVAWSGISAGAGVLSFGESRAGDNAIHWSVNAPADEINSTLTNALAQGHYLSFTIAPEAGTRLSLAGETMRLGIRRKSFHAPRIYTLFSSVEGFAGNTPLLTSGYIDNEDDQELRLTVPDTAAFQAFESGIEFRLYGHSGQFAGHKTSLTDLRIDGFVLTPVEGNGWAVR